MSNQKHQNTGKTAGALVPAWLPGDLIDALKPAMKSTGQSRSFLVAECVREGLHNVVEKFRGSKKSRNGSSSKSTSKKQTKKK